MPLEIKLYEEIGGWGITAKDFTAQIPQDEENVVVRINSPGGDVWDGLAMYNYLRDHPANITTIIDGVAASAASIVFMAGDVRRAHKSSIFMVHQPWTWTAGNAEELRKEADVLDEHGDALIAIYQDRAGMSEEAVREMVDEATWMRGEAALENGFATEVVEDATGSEGNKAAAMVAWSAVFDAIQNGGTEKMTAKDAREGLAAAKAEIETLKAEAENKATEHASQIEALKSEHAAAIEAKDNALAEKGAEVETLTAKVAELGTELTASQEAAVALAAERDTLQADKEKMADALKNPAMADALLRDVKDVDIGIVQDAEAEAAEEAARKKAEEDGEGGSKSPCYDEYKALLQESPRKAHAYHREHAKEIAAEQKALDESGAE